MKAIPPVAPLAALSPLVAGCGSGGKAVSGSITVAGTTTISKVKAGTVLSCKSSGLRATVTDALAGATGSAYEITDESGKGPSLLGSFRLTRSQNGVVTISCTRHPRLGDRSRAVAQALVRFP